MMTATILQTVDSELNVITELTIRDGERLATSYPDSFDSAVDTIESLGIEHVEYETI